MTYWQMNLILICSTSICVHCIFDESGVAYTHMEIFITDNFVETATISVNDFFCGADEC